MVQGTPIIRINGTPAQIMSNPADYQVYGVCVETTKGEPFVVTRCNSATELYQKYKIQLNGFFGVGGQALDVIRVTTGTPAKAKTTFKDTTATPVAVMALEANEYGSYGIYVTITLNSDGTRRDVLIEEDGFTDEIYIGVATIADLVSRINAQSEIVTATFVAEGNSMLALQARTQLGIAAGGQTVVAGSNGTVDSGKTDGTLAAADAPTAHDAGLGRLEAGIIGGVFCLRGEPTVHAKYAAHAVKMSTADEHMWRFAIVGAAAGTAKQTMLDAASGTTGFKDPHIIYVGQGVVDKNGVQYDPCAATQVVAGMFSSLPYNRAIWGGAKSKILGQNGVKFITSVLPMVSASTVTKSLDFRQYNEAGVLTFIERLDGVSIKEDITTYPDPDGMGYDRASVVRIIDYGYYGIYDVCYQMLGENITQTYKTDLEEKIKTFLREMETVDGSLISIPEEDVVASSVSVSILPRANQKKGKVLVNGHMTPIYVAREIDFTLGIE